MAGDLHVAIRVRSDGSDFRTEVLCGDAPAVRATFEFERGDLTETGRALRNLQEGLYGPDDLKYVGSQLWDAVLSGGLAASVRKAIENADWTELSLEVPAEFEELPWEAIWDSQLRFVATHPKVCLTHRLQGRESQVVAPVEADELSILVVIPQGSGLDTGTELANLRACVAKIESAVKIEALRDSVTPDLLSAALQRQRWHVVHFIGHGRLNDNFVELRLNDEQGGENWRNADQFSALFQDAKVDACVLNCCDGGAVTDVRTTDRLAPALLDAGVRAVVAMRYKMTDVSANRFAQTFYDQLLHGSRPGQLAYAAQLARKSLLQNASRDDGRSFITPLVHTQAGVGRLFEISGARARKPVVSIAPVPGANLVPQALIDAVRVRACVPVIGMELAEPALQRRDATLDATSAAGLRGLLLRLRQALAQLSPGASVSSSQEHWPLDSQLSRLAESYEAERNWGVMLNVLRDHYARREPTELHRLVASWCAPGVFYSHFDGLLEAAFAAEARAQVVRTLSEGSTAGIASGGRATAEAGSLLVLVRGSISDPKSLVLSEHDHFSLSDQIERIHPSIASLTKSHFGRSILFLGASPSDRVTRELARKLLEANDPRSTESFFVCEEARPSDELFWRRFRVTFVRAGTDVVVRTLSAARSSP